MKNRTTPALAVLLSICLALGGSAPGGTARAAGIRCFGEKPTLFGTARSDKLVGTKGHDVIVALGGNDVVKGLGGRDRICGGGGSDRLYTNGNDGYDLEAYEYLDGGRGSDRLASNFEPAVLRGGRGQDILLTGNASHSESLGDQLYGGSGHDMLRSDVDENCSTGAAFYGGPGDDEFKDPFSYCAHIAYSGAPGGVRVDLEVGLATGDGTDTTGSIYSVSGSPFDDQLFGREGPEWMDGEAGSDSISSRGGEDTALGGEGDDQIDAGPGDDIVAGEEGNDLCTNAETSYSCERP